MARRRAGDGRDGEKETGRGKNRLAFAPRNGDDGRVDCTAIGNRNPNMTFSPALLARKKEGLVFDAESGVLYGINP
jgi:hypothetical protein